MRRSLVGVLVVILSLLAACVPAPVSQPTQAPEPSVGAPASQTTTVEPINIVVSILPQKYFVERIGGEHVDVTVMVQPGENPATYEPKPSQMIALARAEAYVSIGVSFEEAWLDDIRAANTDMRLVDTTQGIERTPTQDGGFDPHIWLSPSLVKTQSQNIFAGLAEIDPAHASVYQANLEAFLHDIDTLDANIRVTLDETDSKKFIVFHPAWGYFARDYGLEMLPIEVGGQEPSAQELARLIEQARADNIKVVFAQPESSREDANTIAKEIDGEIIVISALNPDWISNLQQVASTFAAVLND